MRTTKIMGNTLKKFGYVSKIAEAFLRETNSEWMNLCSSVLCAV